MGEQIRDLLNRATATDEDEDQRYGKDRRGDELPDGLATRKKRLATIQAARSRRKLFPRPLSPVIRFTRGANSTFMVGAGPTLKVWRHSSIFSVVWPT